MFHILKKKNRNELTQVNLWELIPVRNFNHEINDDNLVTILIPKFTNNFLVQFLMPRLKHPFIKVKLDKIGSAVWLEIDGVKSVGEIATLIESKFKEDVYPVEERFQKFFSQLFNHRFIKFEHKEVKI